jgi:transposase, IS5 family
MRPKQHETTRSGDLFRARLEQIINLKHELVQLAGKIDWEWIDGEIAPLYSDQGRPGIASRFVIGLLLLKHIYGLSDEGVCERWVHDPYFQYFTGEEFFQHSFPHERSDLSHWRQRLGDKLELLLAESLRVLSPRCGPPCGIARPVADCQLLVPAASCRRANAHTPAEPAGSG